MKVKRYIYGALAVAALAVVSFSAYRQLSRPMQVPEFPTVQDGMPASVVELEPDFGYRTGDIVKVRIFVRQPAGITCNTKSLLVNGSTRVREMSVARRQMPDGSEVLRMDVQLQSFVFEQKLKAELKLDYTVAGSRERQELKLSDLEYSTSATYDGDKSSKHPKDPPLVYEATYGWLYTIALATLALALAATSFWYLLKRPVLRRTKKALVPGTDAWKEAVEQVNAIIVRLKAGEPQVPLLRALDGLLRRLYSLDAVTVQDLFELTAKQSPDLMSLTLVSQYCQQAIYAGKLLEVSEISNLSDLVVEALSVLPRFRSQSAEQLAQSLS